MVSITKEVVVKLIYLCKCANQNFAGIATSLNGREEVGAVD